MFQAWHSQPQRRNRYLLVLALVLLSATLLWVARGVLFPYILALLLIYLMLPAVNWLDGRFTQTIKSPRLGRILAIVVVYLACLALVALYISMIVPVLNQQFRALWGMRDTMGHRIQDLAAQSLGWYRTNVPPEIQAEVDDNLRRAGQTVGSALQTGVSRTLPILTGTVSFILGFVVIPFWMFYILYDHKRIRRAIRDLVPVRYRSDAGNVWHLVDGVLGAYIRGQLLLSVTIGLMATVGLTALQVPFPAVLGFFAGLFEFIPFIGPVMGAVPAVVVALIQSPILALWTVLLFLGIQQLENLLLVPRISGHAVKLHPAVIMLVLVIGNEVAGLGGMLIAVPVTAIIRDVFRYLYLRFEDEPCTPEEALAVLEER